MAVEERRLGLAGKSLFNVAEHLEAIVAEVAVLDALARRGTRPVREIRALGGFDWMVERDGRSLPVEVKQKASPGTVGHRLEWFWKGVSLLPCGGFIRNYTWHWHVREEARAADAREIPSLAARNSRISDWSCNV